MTQINKLNLYTCRNKYDYANFVVVQRYDDAAPGNGYFMLAIESTYGNGYAYAWSSIGCTFEEFLANQVSDPWYVAKKMCQGDPRVVDWEETTKRCRQRILEMRRQRLCTAEEAREAWPDSLHESEYEFWTWASGQELVQDTHEEIFDKPGCRSNQFMGLHKAFWADFAAQLLAAGKAAA